MDSYEREAFKKGFKTIAGVDEAGRGPLAGPVVAAAVIFSAPPLSAGIRDSKELTPSRRWALAIEIYRSAVSVGAGVVWPPEIDSINIHRASLLAMERAVSALSVRPDFLLIDGIFPINSTIPQLPVKSGDSLSVSIAAASIIAKTMRDRIMEAYDRVFPGYGFAGHKGYPTSEHREAIRRLGSLPIHRRSFRGVLKD